LERSVTIPDIDSIRDFSTLVGRSGIILEQCAKEISFIDILFNFGISDQFDVNYSLKSEFDYDVKISSLDEKVRIMINENGLKT
jgi:hypothetical protein